MEPTDDLLAQTAEQVHAAKDGSSTAMEGLFERYLPKVRSIVAARMGQRLHAVVELDDIVRWLIVSRSLAMGPRATYRASCSRRRALQASMQTVPASQA